MLDAYGLLQTPRVSFKKLTLAAILCISVNKIINQIYDL